MSSLDSLHNENDLKQDNSSRRHSSRRQIQYFAQWNNSLIDLKLLIDKSLYFG